MPSNINKDTTSNIKNKLLAALDHKNSLHVPRICTLVINNLKILKPFFDIINGSSEISNSVSFNQLFSVIIAVKLQGSKRILRSDEIEIDIAANPTQPRDKHISIKFSFEYNHYHRHGNVNKLQILLQFYKKGKINSHGAYKNIASATVDLSQLINHPYMGDLLLFFDQKLYNGHELSHQNTEKLSSVITMGEKMEKNLNFEKPNNSPSAAAILTFQRITTENLLSVPYVNSFFDLSTNLDGQEKNKEGPDVSESFLDSSHITNITKAFDENQNNSLPATNTKSRRYQFELAKLLKKHQEVPQNIKKKLVWMMNKLKISEEELKLNPGCFNASSDSIDSGTDIIKKELDTKELEKRLINLIMRKRNKKNHRANVKHKEQIKKDNLDISISKMSHNKFKDVQLDSPLEAEHRGYHSDTCGQGNAISDDVSIAEEDEAEFFYIKDLLFSRTSLTRELRKNNNNRFHNREDEKEEKECYQDMVRYHPTKLKLIHHSSSTNTITTNPTTSTPMSRKSFSRSSFGSSIGDTSSDGGYSPINGVSSRDASSRLYYQLQKQLRQRDSKDFRKMDNFSIDSVPRKPNIKPFFASSSFKTICSSSAANRLEPSKPSYATSNNSSSNNTMTNNTSTKDSKQEPRPHCYNNINNNINRRYRVSSQRSNTEPLDALLSIADRTAKRNGTFGNTPKMIFKSSSDFKTRNCHKIGFITKNGGKKIFNDRLRDTFDITLMTHNNFGKFKRLKFPDFHKKHFLTNFETGAGSRNPTSPKQAFSNIPGARRVKQKYNLINKAKIIGLNNTKFYQRHKVGNISTREPNSQTQLPNASEIKEKNESSTKHFFRIKNYLITPPHDNFKKATVKLNVLRSNYHSKTPESEWSLTDAAVKTDTDASSSRKKINLKMYHSQSTSFSKKNLTDPEDGTKVQPSIKTLRKKLTNSERIITFPLKKQPPADKNVRVKTLMQDKCSIPTFRSSQTIPNDLIKLLNQNTNVNNILTNSHTKDSLDNSFDNNTLTKSKLTNEIFENLLKLCPDGINTTENWLIFENDYPISEKLNNKCNSNNLRSMILMLYDIKSLFNYAIEKIDKCIQTSRQQGKKVPTFSLVIIGCGSDRWFHGLLRGFVESLRDKSPEIVQTIKIAFIPFYGNSIVSRYSHISRLIEQCDSKYHEYFGDEKWLSCFQNRADGSIQSKSYDLDIIFNRIYDYILSLNRTINVPIGEVLLNFNQGSSSYVNSSQIFIPFIMDVKLSFKNAQVSRVKSLLTSSKLNKRMPFRNIMDDSLENKSIMSTSIEDELGPNISSAGSIVDERSNKPDKLSQSQSKDYTPPLTPLTLPKNLKCSKSFANTPSKGVPYSNYIHIDYWWYSSPAQDNSVDIDIGYKKSNSSPHANESNTRFDAPGIQILNKLPKYNRSRSKEQKHFKVRSSDSFGNSDFALIKSSIKNGTRFEYITITHQSEAEESGSSDKHFTPYQSKWNNIHCKEKNAKNLLNLMCETHRRQKFKNLGKKEKSEIPCDQINQKRILRLVVCSTKSLVHPLNVIIDGVEWKHVKFFQVSSQWQTHIKTLPLMISSPDAY